MAALDRIEKVSDVVWELPRSYKPGMRVPGRIFATRRLLESMDAAVFEQLANVAMLPGIIGHACCMPDGHSGYGFPIGGVAAMDPDGGVISPGGIGFDINCGMRLVLTNLTYREIKPHIHQLVNELYRRVPAGTGGRGPVEFTSREFRKMLALGARWCLEHGCAWPEDLERTEERGCVAGADPDKVSDKAVERGLTQVGTLGSGNHYLEVQVLHPEGVADPELARAFGLSISEQVVVMFHCGSRGFGHQVATDYLRSFLAVMTGRYGIHVPDRELAAAPLNSPDGQNYFAAMKCAINKAFVNRQMILHQVRAAFAAVFGRTAEELGMHQVYDVAHNTARLERHVIDGRERELLIHRKGATRAFGPGMSDLPEIYRRTGQPVIIGGSMETGSYLLAGVPGGSAAFHSTAHGSGRTMSRTAARAAFQGRGLLRDMESRGIVVRSASLRGLAEEAGAAYKDIDEVVDATRLAGISRPVARFTPVGNIKG